MINRDRLVKSFCDLVSIDSPSGEEEEIAQVLAQRLESLGFEVYRDSFGNVIGSDGRDNPIMLSAHMDTVEPGRGIKPRIEDDRILSDGSTILGGDCKAGIAAILEGLESIMEDKVRHLPVEVVFTREEETGLVGASNLDFSKINSKEAIVFDGEGPPNQITSASPTYVGFTIEVTGRAAHAGVEPEKGISAIRVAAELISALPQGRLDSETTFNIGTIMGGSVRNTVPEITSLTGEFRSLNLEALDGVRLQIDKVLNEVRETHPDAVIDDEITPQFEGYTLIDDGPSIQRVKAAMRSLGLEPTTKPSGGGTDGNVFRLKDIDAVVVGMADHGMHTVREYVTIPDLVDAAHLCEAYLTTRK